MNLFKRKRKPVDAVDYCCAGWAELYARGAWSLEQLEKHLDVYLPILLSTGGTEAS